jgi:ATP phosphoribosyltransferase regulatory subunit
MSDLKMNIGTPAGVRDMLPAEMADITAVLTPLRQVLEEVGFGELHTPALELEAVMALGDVESTEPAFRLLDEQGRTLVLRSDMTIPVARVVATRLRDVPGPFRLYYISHVYRGRPERPGYPREFLQFGAELLGRGGTAGTLELLSAVVRSLAAAGLRRHRIVLGDTTLFPRLLRQFEIAQDTRDALVHELVTRDFAGFKRVLGAACEAGGISGENAELIASAAHLRGTGSIFETLDPRLREVAENLERLYVSAHEEVRQVVMFDFGFVRRLGYYTGEVFEIHHPALGEALGGGGRYDGLLERFGRPMAAIGFGVSVERLREAKRADSDAVLEARTLGETA